MTHDLEGIVAKRKNDPYRRGIHWWKIKNRTYSQADDGRGELLNRERRAFMAAATAKRAKGLEGEQRK